MKLGPRKGMVFVVSAPSGVGKTTLVLEVVKAFPGEVFQVCTCTTRAPRAGEVNGKDYWFLTKEEFQEKKRRGEFLESTETYGYSYGTLKKSVEDLQKRGNVILVIDVKGARNVEGKISIFIEPPSMAELERRIRSRSQEGEEEIQKRLVRAKEELQMAGSYDYRLINDDLPVAIEIVRSIIIAESFRRI